MQIVELSHTQSDARLYAQLKGAVESRIYTEIPQHVHHRQVAAFSEHLLLRLVVDYKLEPCPNVVSNWTRSNEYLLSDTYQHIVNQAFTMLKDFWGMKSDLMYSFAVRLLDDLVTTFSLAPRM